MSQSENSRVKFLYESCASTQRSIIGSNLTVIQRRLQFEDVSDVIQHGQRTLRQAYVHECAERDLTDLSLINDLRGVMKGTHSINGFSFNEIESILEFVCTE